MEQVTDSMKKGRQAEGSANLGKQGNQMDGGGEESGKGIGSEKNNSTCVCGCHDKIKYFSCFLW